MDCRALESNYSLSASMTLYPFEPTFRPQQRPKLWPFCQPKARVAVIFSEPSDSPATGAKASTANSRFPQIEEQIHSLSVQLDQTPDLLRILFPANDSLDTEVPISPPETDTVSPFGTVDSCKTSTGSRVRKT